MEDASEHSGQRFVAVVNGTAAGGGCELALATDHIMMIDDRSTAVSLPEVPLLAVLPGTGGLTRGVDKRMVRRDHADVFWTIEEGIKGKRAVQWRLIDELISPSKLEARVKAMAAELAAKSPRKGPLEGVKLLPIDRNCAPSASTIAT
jgi:benzoyl-CoA-dihydrodiol lyase